MDTIANSVTRSVQPSTPTKRGKPKSKKRNNKPIKVVYISNPMKVKTSPSEFRALVQELTGQDAESPPDPSRFQHPDDGGGGGGGDGGLHQIDPENCVTKIGHDESDLSHTVVVPPQVDPDDNSQGQQPTGGGSSMENFEPFDDVFTRPMIEPQMIESISAFLPASVFYECAQVGQVLMQCNYIRQ